MIDIEILNTGVYYSKERHVQQVNNYWIGLYISGLKYHTVRLPDGSLIEKFDEDPGPHLFWRVPGMQINFEYGENRENWVLMLKSDNLVYDPNDRALKIRYNDCWIPVPFCHKISRETVVVMRSKFDNISRLWNDGLPGSRLAATLHVGELFAGVLERRPIEKSSLSPAEKLKQLIDHDKLFQYDLRELSEQAGFSADYLRICFINIFHISPGKYRDNCRMSRVMELINHSELSPGEIAAQVGLKHSSHLNVLLRKACNRTPSELIKMYRFNSPG